jgi:hypothetical protein
MKELNHTSYYLHKFSSWDDISFRPQEYALLKFGDDQIAKKFGTELAMGFFKAHSEKLLSDKFVVIPSPYNHIKNAATLITEHFINALNLLLVNANGEHVDSSIIHRKVSYTNDYGFLDKDTRQKLLSNDKFYMNKKFLKGKSLIFIDDVCITGTHEDKLLEILAENRMYNDTFFVYFAKYFGTKADIESKLNFAGINTVSDVVDIINSPNHHMIIRPIKYLLSLNSHEFNNIIVTLLKQDKLEALYYASLAEGYYKIPKYQSNFQKLSARLLYIINETKGIE